MTPDRDKALPYYRWYVAEYRGSLRVQDISWQARAIYREVLDEIWRSGCIADEIQIIASVSRVPIGVVIKHWPQVRNLLVPVPGLDGQLLTSERLEAERSKDDKARVQRSLAGQASAAARQRALNGRSIAFREEESSKGDASGDDASVDARPKRLTYGEAAGEAA